MPDRITRRTLLRSGLGGVAGLGALVYLGEVREGHSPLVDGGPEAVHASGLVRRFHGSDAIRCAVGGSDLDGALTVAVAFRVEAADRWHALIANRGARDELALWMVVDPRERVRVGLGAGLLISGAGEIQPGRWHIAVARKGVGDGAGRLSIYDPKPDSWTHVVEDDLADLPSQAGGSIDFGTFGGDARLIGDLAAAAEWRGALTDEQVEALATFLPTLSDLAGWQASKPTALWRFDQATTRAPVTDLSGNGADQVDVSGTSVFAPGTFESSFESGMLNEWTSFDRSDGGEMLVATAAAEGIPALAGEHVARFGVSALDARREDVHSKVYKSWAVGPPSDASIDDSGRFYEPLPEGGPDGVYSAWFFLPVGYEPHSDWANVLQWKEGYLDDPEDEESWRQDPQWWLNIAPAGEWSRDLWPRGTSAGDPVLVTNNWGGVQEARRRLLAPPRGRWFEIRADLRSGDRIEWHVDGALWQTSRSSRYPVGLSKPRAVEWVFGVGHYGGLGHLWVDAVRYDPA